MEDLAKLQQQCQNKRRQARLHNQLLGYKSGKTCLHCPENHIYCLEFHHRDPATKDPLIDCIYDAIRRLWGWDRILAELGKCDLLCGNCHRIKHWQERDDHIGKRKKQQLYWAESAGMVIKCSGCDNTNPICVEFHHRDPSTKTNKVNKIASRGLFLAEVAKCDQLCVNCHRKHHFANVPPNRVVPLENFARISCQRAIRTPC